MQQVQEDEAAPSNRREDTTAIRSTEIIYKSILGRAFSGNSRGQGIICIHGASKAERIIRREPCQ